MGKDIKSPRRLKPENITELLKKVVSAKDTEINNRIQEASKPLFLARYE